MKKLRLEKTEMITFKEGCERYLNDCRIRNLREGTIGQPFVIDNFLKKVLNYWQLIATRHSY